MKMLSILLLAFSLHLPAGTFAQTFNISVKDEKLEAVFKQIQQQSNYRFIYTRNEISTAPKVTLSLTNGTISQVLMACFANQSLAYSIEDNFIIIRNKEFPARNSAIQMIPGQISGRIINHKQEPVPGATVSIKGRPYMTVTNEAGTFLLNGVDTPGILSISSVGYQSRELKLELSNSLLIVLHPFINNLNETIVIGYGVTTRKLNTGSVAKISSETIARQPVSSF
ncbi:MAG: carboxypeptidase-like regulatory domain-containing protein, partial [Chitinophagaceae bacterium]|nr:carboxypeptidase-like regulatory domain-containing protein [Chitinophagaceae bacterium]